MNNFIKQPVSEESVIKKLVELNDQLGILFYNHQKKEIPTIEILLLIENIINNKPDWNNISFIEKHTRGN